MRSVALAGRRSPVHAVEQFAHGDDADRAFLSAECRLGFWTAHAALAVDEQVGVNQEGHGSPSAAMAARAARTSATKSSSSGGAVAISSRKRSAESSCVAGGPITATGAPLRVTSTCSPPATRFRTSEKLRAASVGPDVRAQTLHEPDADSARRRREVDEAASIARQVSLSTPRSLRVRLRRRAFARCSRGPGPRSDRIGMQIGKHRNGALR